jgi:hypothetical protein
MAGGGGSDPVDCAAMLTRSAVAKRLGRSLATVRRLEGHELFPQCDARGVHWFDEAEVAAVAQRVARGEATSARGLWLTCLPAPFSREASPLRPRPSLRTAEADSSTSNADEVARLRQENAELRADLADLSREVRLFVDGIDCR